MDIEVYSVGELLVDITILDPGLVREGTHLEIHFGGAPANVAIGVSRLGHKSGMISCVGNDIFGDFLIRTLEENGVDTKFVKRKNARTTLAFVMLYENAEREFFFYRLPWANTADSMLEPNDINLDEISKARVIHFSGFATSHGQTADTILYMIRRLSHAGVTISYDPTFRKDVWITVDKALKVHSECMKYVNFLSMGIDELKGLYGDISPNSLAEKLFNKYPNLETIAIRLGSRGAYVRTRSEEVEVPAFRITPVDTTGAGDAWTAGFIVYYLLEENGLERAVKYANAVAAIKCMARGAITSLPHRRTVEEFVNKFINDRS
ncbi:MAG: sugar kinase [Desulfurococcaceae archaeon]